MIKSYEISGAHLMWQRHGKRLINLHGLCNRMQDMQGFRPGRKHATFDATSTYLLCQRPKDRFSVTGI